MGIIEQAANELFAILAQAQDAAYRAIVGASNFVGTLINATATFVYSSIILPLATVAGNVISVIANQSFRLASFVFNNALVPIANVAWTALTFVFKNVCTPLYTLLKNSALHLVNVGHDIFTRFISPVLNFFYDQIAYLARLAANMLHRLWLNIVFPAIQALWRKFTSFWINTLAPILDAIADKIAYYVDLAVNNLIAFWDNVLYPAINFIVQRMENLAKLIFDKILQPLQDLALRAAQYIYRQLIVPMQNALIRVWLFFVQNIWPSIVRFAHAAKDLIIQAPQFIFNSLQVVGNVVLGVVGMPIYAFNHLTGRAAAYTAVQGTSQFMQIFSASVGAVTVGIVAAVMVRRYYRNNTQESAAGNEQDETNVLETRNSSNLDTTARSAPNAQSMLVERRKSESNLLEVARNVTVEQEAPVPTKYRARFGSM